MEIKVKKILGSFVAVLFLVYSAHSFAQPVLIGGFWYTGPEIGPGSFTDTESTTTPGPKGESFDVDASGAHMIDETTITEQTQTRYAWTGTEGGGIYATDLCSSGLTSTSVAVTEEQCGGAAITLSTRYFKDKLATMEYTTNELEGLADATQESVITEATTTVAFVGKVATYGTTKVNTGAIKVNTDATKVNTGAIEVNTDAIEVNTDAIEVNTDAIKVNTGVIGVLRNEVNSLKDDVKVNKSGIAMAVALSSNIYIPSDKKNGFGLSVGGFDGETAIAAQFVNRINADTSINLGVANANSETAVRAGFSFAW